MEGPATGLYPPPGWVNNTTPAFSSVQCGFISQTQNWVTDGSSVLSIGFDGASSWTSGNWVTNDLSGYQWGCRVGGIYQVAAEQNLLLFNAADATNPVVNITLTIFSPTTSEFNQVFQTSIAVPITTAPISMSVNVGGLVNVDEFSTMSLTVQSLSGNVTCTSGAGVLGSPGGSLSWNLVAQGAYGNVGLVIV